MIHFHQKSPKDRSFPQEYVANTNNGAKLRVNVFNVMRNIAPNVAVLVCLHIYITVHTRGFVTLPQMN